MFAVPTGTWASKNNQSLHAPLPKASALRSLKEKDSVWETQTDLSQSCSFFTLESAKA